MDAVMYTQNFHACFFPLFLRNCWHIYDKVTFYIPKLQYPTVFVESHPRIKLKKRPGYPSQNRRIQDIFGPLGEPPYE